MVGRDTGKCYKLGQKVKIAVYDVDVFTKNIDFVLADEEEE